MASPLVHAHLRLDVAAWCSSWTGTSTIKLKDSDPNIYMDSHYQNNNNKNPFIALRQGELDRHSSPLSGSGILPLPFLPLGAFSDIGRTQWGMLCLRIAWADLTLILCSPTE